MFLVAIFVGILFYLLLKVSRKQHRVKGAKFQPIQDNYATFEELQVALRKAGLESSNLIVGVDFTRSNEWTGQLTFGGKCLHYIGEQCMNPYQTVIRYLGQTLEAFDDDKLIPAFGFGDSTTSDKSIFSFFPNGQPCRGFEEVLQRYTTITPSIVLSGPTNFAPLIREAIRITQKEQGYHILLIIADGQVTNEDETRDAIIEASNYPLSIILVGVGDGPWDMMEEFDDGLPSRQFDNFQFVNFHDVMTRYDGDPVTFARFALMEIPEQYTCIKNLGLLNFKIQNRH